MQEMRHGQDGTSWLCMADSCDETATVGWSRATQDGGTTQVEACPEHALDPEDAALTHQPGCLAPPECTCKAST